MNSTLQTLLALGIWTPKEVASAIRYEQVRSFLEEEEKCPDLSSMEVESLLLHCSWVLPALLEDVTGMNSVFQPSQELF